MWVRSLGQKDALEEGMATHSSIFVWRISRTKEPQLQPLSTQTMYSFIPLVYWRHHITCYFSLNIIKSKYINFLLQTHQASEPMQVSLPSVSSSQPLSTQILAWQLSFQCLLHRARLSLTTVPNIMGNLMVLTPIRCLFLVKHIQHLISIPWFVCLLYTSILQNVSFMRVRIPLIYSCLNPQPLAHCLVHNKVFGFVCIFNFLLEYSCLTVLCSFAVQQSESAIHIHISSLRPTEMNCGLKSSILAWEKQVWVVARAWIMHQPAYGCGRM